MVPDADRLPPPRSGDSSDPALVHFLNRLRDKDPAFSEASLLCEDNLGEWQAAVYLLTGCDSVWGHLGAAVMEEVSMAPVLNQLANPTRYWSHSAREVMVWAAHFWNYERNPASFPTVFDRFLFERWINALRLRQNLAPDLPATAP
jgi:hypothetical protein